MKSILIGLLLLIVSGDLWGADKVSETVGKLQLEYGGGLPAVRISNENTSFSLNAKEPGRLQVVYTDDRASKSAWHSMSMRSLFFFPRLPGSKEPQFRKMSDGDLALTLGPGNSLIFSSATGRIRSLSGGKIRQLPSSLRNGGGLQVDRVENALVLDCGFSLGDKPPYRDLNHSCTFIDPSGHRCTLKASSLFIPIDKYDARLKFATDQALEEFLNKQANGRSKTCSKLDLRMLKNSNQLSDAAVFDEAIRQIELRNKAPGPEQVRKPPRCN